MSDKPDKCEACGIDITNSANLSKLTYNGKEVWACPGCNGAAR